MQNASIGIIGGADGPTSIFVSSPGTYIIIAAIAISVMIAAALIIHFIKK